MRAVVVGAGLAGLVGGRRAGARRRRGRRARGALARRRAGVVADAPERRGRGDGRRVHPARATRRSSSWSIASASASGTRACATGGATRAAASARRTRSWPPPWRRSRPSSLPELTARRAPRTSSTRSTSRRARARRSSRAWRSRARTPPTAWPRADLGGRGAHRRRALAEHRRRQPAPAARAGRRARRRRCTWTTPSRRSEWDDARARAHRRPASSRRTRAWSPCPPSVLDRIAFEPALPERAAPMRSAWSSTATRRSCSCRSACPPRAERGDERARALLDLDGHRRRRRAAAGRERLRRLERPRSSASTSTPGPSRWLDSLTRPARRPGAGPERRGPLHLGRRSLGARGLLDLAAAPRWPRRPRGRRPARSPSPASTPPGEHHGADGGRDQERAARRSVAASGA